MRKKISYTQKLLWLWKHHVVLKKEKVSESTVNRLYSFYLRNPLSTPRNLAYGLPKRIERTLKKEQEFQTPKGKITSKQYIQNYDKASREKILKEVSQNVNRLYFNRHMKNGKVRDCFAYHIAPPHGIEITNVNKFNMLERLQRYELPDLMRNISLIWKGRQRLYKGYEICGIVIYDVENAPQSADPRGVGFTEYANFEKYLYDMIWELVINDVLRNYPEAVITLRRFEIALTTPVGITDTDRLR